jgi:tetratricopeptide (TPR) repeat protein
MKDPLCIKETPYEVLNLEVNVDKKAIDTAFKKYIASGLSIEKAKEAWSNLSKPLERSLVDVFLYNKDYIDQLVPHIVTGDVSRLLDQRNNTALAWSNIQKKLFPHFGSTHSLAVLWYSWAIYCEEEQWANIIKASFNKKENLPKTPLLNHLWANTISNWVFLINCKDFWIDWTKLKQYSSSDLIAESLPQRLENHFINLFNGFSERYRSIGDNISIRRYQEYENLFTLEMKTAKNLFNEGISITKNGIEFTLCCGRIMLEQLDLLSMVMKQLEENLESSSHKNRLRALITALSPFANIAALIENKKFDEAIYTIESLTTEEKRDREVLHLLVKAYLGKGKQCFSLNNYKDAMSSWEKAFEVKTLREEVEQVIVNNCNSKAISLQRSDPDTAIIVLEMGIKIIDSAALKNILSVIYCSRGVTRILEAQNVQKKEQQEWIDKNGIKKEVSSEIEKGVDDLRKAVEFDSSNSHARNELKIAEEIFNSQMCWFCRGKKNTPVESAAYKIQMYGEVQHLYFGRRVQWKTLTIPIPRCERCKNAHARIRTFSSIGGVIGFSLGLTSCITAYNSAGGFVGIIILGIITAVFIAIGYFIGRVSSRNVSTLSIANNFPLVKQKLSEGWKIGNKPPNVQ